MLNNRVVESTLMHRLTSLQTPGSNDFFTMALGSNDFLDNYLTPLFSIPKRVLVSPQLFVATLVYFSIQFWNLNFINFWIFLCNFCWNI